MNDSSHLAGAVAEKSKHTPGPWCVGSNMCGRVEVNPSIATCYGATDGLANARLIAAAPDLLEQARRFHQALRQLRAGTWTDRDLLALQPELEAAVAKAEGE